MTSLTDAQWEGLRELVRARVGDALRRQVPELRLTPIDLAALNAAKPWRAAQAVGWEWPAVIKRRRANRFDLAIWHGEILCGLAYGPADAAWVAIGFLQSNPDPAHPLRGRVIPIALAVLEAQMLAAEARLLSPFPELVPRYDIVSQIYDFITDFAQRSGIVIVLAEQMATLALKVSDRGYVLRRGRVVQEGDSRDLLADNAASLTASYL